jgi:hypothetical protein
MMFITGDNRRAEKNVSSCAKGPAGFRRLKVSISTALLRHSLSRGSVNRGRSVYIADEAANSVTDDELRD